MKELLLTTLKYYAIAGGICAALSVIWIIVIQSAKADRILGRGNAVKIKDGPTFEPGCSTRVIVADYLVLVRGFGIAIMTFLAWPIMLYITFTDPRWWCMVEEINIPKEA